LNKELSIKDDCIQGGGGFSSANILQIKGEGVLQMWTSALFGAKHIEFFEIFVMSAQTGGLSQYGIFRTRGKRVNFCDFVRTFFMDGP